MATQISFIFTPKIGEDEPILTIIFFKGVGSTTNQNSIDMFHCSFLFNERPQTVCSRLVLHGSTVGQFSQCMALPFFLKVPLVCFNGERRRSYESIDMFEAV